MKVIPLSSSVITVMEWTKKPLKNAMEFASGDIFEEREPQRYG